nr:transposase [Halomonas andesensis]
MSISRGGVDIAKSVFHVHGVYCHDQVEWRGKYKRDKWLDAIVKRPPTGTVIGVIGMEACASAHHWACELQARGYHVKLIAAQFVKPYVIHVQSYLTPIVPHAC